MGKTLVREYKQLNVGQSQDKLSLYSAFLEIALKYQTRIALCDGRVVLTYSELLAKINALASNIMRILKLHHNEVNLTVIPILLPRSYQAVITILSILKLQKPFLALSETLPIASIREILSQNNVKLLFSNNELKNKYHFEEDITVVDVDALLESKPFSDKEIPELNVANDNELAYFIYTSGTTGEPKCVRQTHKTLLNLIYWQDYCKEVEVVLNRASLFFDVAVQEIFFAFLNGARLVIMPDKIKYDAYGFSCFVKENNIQYLQVTPSFLKSIAEEVNQHSLDLADLKFIIASGEALVITKAIQKMLSNHKNMRLINQYGPSETHVVTEFQLSSNQIGAVSIGKPISNTNIYLLDDNNLPVFAGEIGEICISGVGLCKGYAGPSRYPENKFISNIFDHLGEMMYKTGDLGALDKTGNIIFHGRKDRQIQLEGYRIELDALENCVRQDEFIKDCVSVHDDSADQQALILFVVVKPDAPKYSTEEQLHRVNIHLKKIMPSHVKFHKLNFIDKIPLNINGKINYKQLMEMT